MINRKICSTFVVNVGNFFSYNKRNFPTHLSMKFTAHGVHMDSKLMRVPSLSNITRDAFRLEAEVT